MKSPGLTATHPRAVKGLGFSGPEISQIDKVTSIFSYTARHAVYIQIVISSDYVSAVSEMLLFGNNQKPA